MAPSAQCRRPKSLSHGRPAGKKSSTKAHLGSSKTQALSSRHTRRLIRSHHTLQKQLAKAVNSNNPDLASSLQKQLDNQGGLELYQTASINGADRRRGGDTSKKLLEFLAGTVKQRGGNSKLKLLDVGALSVDTAASQSGLFDITRIDLHSRDKAILEQDFMQRPLPAEGPTGDAARFDVVCLSLVVNYVPQPSARGDMLRRACSFLTNPDRNAERDKSLPVVFLVLPAPCVMNSRYLDQQRLGMIMKSLGFNLLQQTITAKLAYFLWQWQGFPEPSIRPHFKKTIVNPGKTRNNFAITLTPG